MWEAANSGREAGWCLTVKATIELSSWTTMIITFFFQITIRLGNYLYKYTGSAAE